MLSIIIGLVFAGILIYILFLHPKNETKATVAPAPATVGNSHALQLQAYERLTLLADRIALPNLISRTPGDGLLARDMQLLLTRLIREEFDYNVTQQIYVSPEAWNAVRNLKEKNLLTINQIGQLLPPEATGLDLQKQLLQYLVNEPKANLHELVSEALGFEARKLL
ncbi:MAG TPA: hypothetical protein VJ552_06665 [Sediminibacterium sp.]|nr:hypothetical protein [Sediminibacterium sp.]